MLAFGKDNEVRGVEVPDERLEGHINIADDLNVAVVLDLVYHYGQNDFQPQKNPSVSMADVIVYNDERYLVCGFGFRKLTQIEFDEFLKLPRVERSMSDLVRNPTL